MARLTDELNAGMQGKPVRDPGYVPGGTATALGMLSSGMDAFMERKNQLAVKRRQAEKDAFEKTGRAAEYEAFMDPIQAQQDVAGSAPVQTPPVDVASLSTEDQADRSAEGAPLSDAVFTTPVQDIPDAAVRDANAGADRLASVAAAVEQGTMPAISLNAAMSRQMLATINKYPEHVTAIMKIWKDRGIDDPTIRAVIDEQRQHEASVSRDIKQQDEWLKKGYEVSGPAAEGMSNAQIMAEGLRAINQEYKLSQLKARTEIAQMNANISETERKAQMEDLANDAYSMATQEIHNRSVGIKQALQQAMNMIAERPIGEQEAAFEQFAPRLEQLRGNLVDQIVADYVVRFPHLDQAKLHSNLMNRTETLLQPFKDDIKTSSSNLRSLDAMETRLKIDAAEAMPVFSALKTLGLDGPEVEQAMMGMSPEMLSSLRQEIKGFTGEFGQERASTRMMNIFAMLKGRGKPFADLSPTEQREAVNIASGTLAGEITRFTRGQISDTSMLVNKAGVMITAARGIGPTSTLRTLELATLIAAPEGRRSLIQIATNPNDPNNEEAMATIMGSRAASALVLESVQNKVRAGEGGNKYWSATWDSKAGKWTARFDEATYAEDLRVAQQGSQNPRFAGLRISSLPSRVKPETLEKTIGIANVHLDNIMALKDYDPTTPKGTDIELRNYYGNNVTPPSMRQEGRSADPKGNIDDVFEVLEDAFERAPAIISEVSSPPAQQWRRKAPPEILRVVEGAALRHGVDPDVAVAIIGKESSFTPGIEGTVVKGGDHAGDRAMGLGQVMAKTAAKYGVTDRSSLTPAEEADLAMRVLADNYQSTGNWRDAVSMYFTGNTYAKAKKRGALDDNGTTIDDYIKAVFG